MSRYFGRPYYKVYRLYEEPTDWFYVKNETDSAGEINIGRFGTPSTHPQYSLDGINWTTATSYDSPTIPAGGKLFFRSADGLNDENNQWYLQTYMNISIGGNLATLVNWMDEDGLAAFPSYFLKNFFSQNKSYYIDASQLTTGNVHVASDNAFREAFQNLYITSIGDFSSLTTLGYNSFYQAFQSCQNLTTGIDLSNVTSVTMGSLSYIYAYCNNIEDVTAPNVSEWNEQATNGWLADAGSYVSGTKTAHVPNGVTIPDGWSGINNSWTRVTY